MNRNRSEFDAHAGLVAARAARAARKPAAPRRSLPLVRVLKLAAWIVAAVIVATEAAPHVLAVLS